MILLDTNVLIYAFDLDSPFYQWARETIADAVAGDGADHRDKQLVEAEIAGVKRLGYRAGDIANLAHDVAGPLGAPC
jgi:predicted nucleic acid-binding protein